jgi:hypothetical protein
MARCSSEVYMNGLIYLVGLIVVVMAMCRTKCAFQDLGELTAAHESRQPHR